MLQNKQLIDISTSTILRTVIVLSALAFVYLIRDIMIVLFFALIVASAINPIVSFLQRKKVPRLFSVMTIYAFGLVVFASIIYIVVPPLAQEIQELAKTLPEFISRISAIDYKNTFNDILSENSAIASNASRFLNNLGQKLETFSYGFLGATANVFGGIISGVLVLVISFYLSVQEDGIKKFMRSVIPTEHQPYVFHLWSRTELKLGRWLQGQLMLALIIGVLTFVGLSVLGVKYALALAIIAGLFELIPYAGPILAAIPAILLGATQAPMLGVWVLVLYIIIQQAENHILVPKVMQHAVSLNPIIIIIAILIGAKLAGIIGIIIAVPIAAILAEIFTDFTSHEDWSMKDMSLH